MVSCPRNDVISPEEVGAYHLWGRCVRQMRLCGYDEVTGRDYSYRRDWIRDLERKLASLFAIEIGFHAELSNHIHLVVRNRPDISAIWTERDVVHRWLKISHLAKSMNGEIKDITEAKIEAELAKPGRVDELRKRLADPSWLMAILNENIARRCNREDDTSGHFWEERFSGRRLENEASILVCGIYVDLNQIRAGEATTPESSKHTSAFDRIQALLGARDEECVTEERGVCDTTHQREDDWLCELTLRDRIGDSGDLRSTTGRRASDKGLLPIEAVDYLKLLDASGRTHRQGKQSIPAELEPIMQRIGINSKLWSELVANFHRAMGQFVGTAQQLSARAAHVGRKRIRGQKLCADAFGV